MNEDVVRIYKLIGKISSNIERHYLVSWFWGRVITSKIIRQNQTLSTFKAFMSKCQILVTKAFGISFNNVEIIFFNKVEKGKSKAMVWKNGLRGNLDRGSVDQNSVDQNCVLSLDRMTKT